MAVKMIDSFKYGRELPGYPFNMRAFLTRVVIVIQRQLFAKWLRSVSAHAPLEPNWTGQTANDTIRKMLDSPRPCMICRFGSGEMETTLRYLDIVVPGGLYTKLGRMFVGRSGPFWWDNSIRAGVCWLAGVFPPTDETLNRFGARVIDDCQEIDVLASWLAGEKRLHALCFPKAKSIPLIDLEPFFVARPWTAALENKTVLVVHPFVHTIRRQFKNRTALFSNAQILPDFTLKTYQAVQSFAGNTCGFKTWFDALDHMCEDIGKIDFDIALIGAGAYGMPIAAHIKRMGRKAVHMGGITQLLFGIKGKRWDGLLKYREGLYNDAWVRPLQFDHPPNFQTIESGSYW